jgi:hypothetical protein
MDVAAQPPPYLALQFIFFFRSPSGFAFRRRDLSTAKCLEYNNKMASLLFRFAIVLCRGITN